MPAKPTMDANWLVRLRWGSTLGQVLTLLGAALWFHVRLPWLPLALVLALEVALTLVAARLRARWITFPPAVAAAFLTSDVVVLTALLSYTGGPHNPFTSFYLVNVVLAAVVLGARWAWPLLAVSAAGFGLLFVASRPMEVPGMGSHAAMMRLHMQGMWVAFAVAAVFLVYFVNRVTRELARREAELHRAREAQLQGEKLTSLGALAAGAAHELATPLSTIAVVAKDLERCLGHHALPAEVIDDARLIRAEVGRCRAILDQLAADAGQAVGGQRTALTLAALLREGTAGLDDARVDVSLAPDAAERPLWLPRGPVQQAIRSLVENGLQASRGAVRVCGTVEDTRVVICVQDDGPGMTPEVLARAGEPFFTSKAPGQGMGLGLFLARAVAEQLGGALHLHSQPSTGTVATLTLARQEA